MMFSRKLDAFPMYILMRAFSAFCFALIFNVNMVYQVTVIGLSPIQLVLVGTTLEVVVFFFEIPTGIVADVYSRRLSLILGYLLVGIGFLIEGMIPTFGAVLLTQVVWGIGITFTSGAEQAWIMDELGETQATHAFLRGSQAGTVGSLIGILLAGLIGSILHINIPILLGAVGLLGLGLFMSARMPETNFHPTSREDRNNWQHMLYTLRSGLRVIRFQPVLITVVAIGLVYGLYSEGYDRLNVQHILTNFTFPVIGELQPVAWISLMNAVSMVIGLVLTEAVQRRLKGANGGSLAKALRIITIPMILSLIVFGLAQSLLIMVLSYWAFRVLRGLIEPLYSAWINHYIPSSVRATMNSMMGQIDAVGQIAGGPLVGSAAQALTDTYGLGLALRLTMVVVGLMLTPLLYLYGRAFRQHPQEVSLPVEVSSAAD